MHTILYPTWNTQYTYVYIELFYILGKYNSKHVHWNTIVYVQFSIINIEEFSQQWKYIKNPTCWSLLSVKKTSVPGSTTTPAEMRLPAALMYLTVQLLSQQLSPCESLWVAAFSIEKFGTDKSKNPILWVHLPQYIEMHGPTDFVEIFQQIQYCLDL